MDVSSEQTRTRPCTRSWRLRRGGVVAGIVTTTVALAFGAVALRAQTKETTISTNVQTTPSMTTHPFALIFRQAPRQLSEAEQKQRADEVRAWALRQNSEGRKLEPHLLTEDVRRIDADSGSGAKSVHEEHPIVAIVFLEARDFAEAVEIAKAHPGLRYGVSIEVRPWTLPPGVPQRRAD